MGEEAGDALLLLARLNDLPAVGRRLLEQDGYEV